MNLNESEKLVFGHLKEGELGMKDLQSLLGVSRHSVTVRMKYLAAKIAPHGWIIENVGGVGRGKRSVYKMMKKF